MATRRPLGDFFGLGKQINSNQLRQPPRSNSQIMKQKGSSRKLNEILQDKKDKESHHMSEDEEVKRPEEPTSNL